MIHITSKLHGVEVSGMRHPMRTVNYTDDQISDEQLAAFLQSEYLTVGADADSAERLREIAFDDELGPPAEPVATDGTGEALPEIDGTVEQVAEGVVVSELIVQPEAQIIETDTSDDALGDGVDETNAGSEVAGDGADETLPGTDGTVEQAPESATITEAESVAQAQLEPAAETAATVEKKTAPASTRKPKK